jgi:hypothetical protein
MALQRGTSLPQSSALAAAAAVLRCCTAAGCTGKQDADQPGILLSLVSVRQGLPVAGLNEVTQTEAPVPASQQKCLQGLHTWQHEG